MSIANNILFEFSLLSRYVINVDFDHKKTSGIAYSMPVEIPNKIYHVHCIGSIYRKVFEYTMDE